MKKAVFLLMISLSATIPILAQTDTFYTRTSSNTIVMGIQIPFGEFSETHFGGLGLNYAWSDHRFGILTMLPEKMVGLTANGGIDYYIRRKDELAGYDFRYGGYVYLHAFGGAIFNPCKKGNISLTTGPTLGIYKGNADPGFGVNLTGSYYFTHKIAFTPGVIYMKHAEANALWVVSIRASYNF